ncbi:MAG: hypothetical protein JWR02_150 [Mucilaginibacter sp.]|nr:hypothetical protein [Mucilaginibacter sp.]
MPTVGDNTYKYKYFKSEPDSYRVVNSKFEIKRWIF